MIPEFTKFTKDIESRAPLLRTTLSSMIKVVSCSERHRGLISVARMLLDQTVSRIFDLGNKKKMGEEAKIRPGIRNLSFAFALYVED